MRCLSRMGLGLVGLALVAPPAAFADAPYASPPYASSPYTSPPDTASPPPQRSLFHRAHLCAACQRADFKARGIAVPAAPKLPSEGMVPSNQKCDRCGGVVAMFAGPSGPGLTPAPALSAVMAPPMALTLSEAPASTPAPANVYAPSYASAPAPAPTPVQPSAPAFTQVAPSPAPAPPALASSPPLVPGPSSGRSWASVPASTSSLVVASMVAPAPTPPPPAAPTAVASTRTRSRRMRSAQAPATALASNGSQAAACEACAAGNGDAAGHAVAGGSAIIGGTMPLAEPTPIGVIQGRYAYQDQTPGLAVAGGLGPGGHTAPGANTRGPGSSDPSVMPTSFNTEPYDGTGHNRPHVLSHVFGLDAIGRHSREAKARRRDEKHASIPYQPLSEQKAIEDLPARMVYGR